MDFIVNETIIEQHFKNVYEFLKIQVGLSKEDLKLYCDTYEEIKNSINWEAIQYCLSKFVNCETDCVTSGNRGLGRSTEYYPRLGGYARKSINLLSKSKKREFSNLIFDVMIDSYIATIFQYDSIPIIKPIEGNELYKKWIPGIYVQNLKNYDNVYNCIYGYIQYSVDKLVDFININKIKGGGLFKTSKIKNIIFMYNLAGSLLRIDEISLNRKK